MPMSWLGPFLCVLARGCAWVAFERVPTHQPANARDKSVVTSLLTTAVRLIPQPLPQCRTLTEITLICPATDFHEIFRKLFVIDILPFCLMGL